MLSVKENRGKSQRLLLMRVSPGGGKGGRDFLPRWLVAAYALPSVPLAMLLTPIIIYLPAFYAGHLGISLSALGVVFFAGRLWDGLMDPVVGRLSDQYLFRFGRRKPWLVAGTPFLMVFTYFLCRPPAGVGVFYLFVALVLFYVAYTVVRIPYISWGAELSENYHERNRIAGFREFGSMVGIFISVGVPYFFLGGENASMDNIMRIFSYSVIAIMPVLVIVSAMTVPDRSPAVFHKKTLIEDMRIIWRNKLYLRIILAQSLLFLGTYIYNACLVFLVEQAMGLKGGFLPLILIEYTAMLAVVPGVIWLANRLGKHRMLTLGVFIQILAFVVMMNVHSGQFWQAAVGFALIGVSLASWYIVPSSLIADAVDYGKMRGGADVAGIYMAFFNFIDKAALAVAALVALPLLDFLGFDPKGGNSGAALRALDVVGLGIPILIIAGAAVLYWNYPLTEKKHRVILHFIARGAARRKG